MSTEDKLKETVKALYRLIRFNRALIQMGAVETHEALDAELKLAFNVYFRNQD